MMKSLKQKKIYFINWRFTFINKCIKVVIGILLIRIAYLQIFFPEKLIKEGDSRSLRIQKISSTRGIITDREGSKLAVSVPVNAIWADPKEIIEKWGIINYEYWKALSDILEVPLKQITNKILNNQKSRFVYLARQITPSIANYIDKLKIPGIYLCKESRRYYPLGPITANLLGITNIDGDGIEGIEKSFNLWLKGFAIERTVRRDRNGRIIEITPHPDIQEKHDLILSIDERIQSIVYRELTYGVEKNNAESGVAILIDVNTGEILAMANYPSYNPNNIIGISKDAMRNRAITDIFEPGSTVKPLVIMSALRNKIIKENMILNTLPYQINGHIIKDVINYNNLSITGILKKSSNVGISKIALSMPITELIDIFNCFGFGKPTNLGLIGENNGIFPNKKTKWSNLEKAIFSFGYGQMVTPLQLARAYSIIGSLGVYHPLSIIKKNQPTSGVRVFPESIIKNVIHMMESVALPGGGGSQAAIKGYRIAVKTGTTKKVGPNGFYVKKYIAYTAGVASASAPRYALVVLVNEPNAGKYYGGAVSAPIFGAIMKNVLRLMNIKPDGFQIYDKNEILKNKKGIESVKS
ncbi:Peptidoglycan synthase FtsI [Candidatus Providencia siddallii]|uniref:Peptidoglycan D,D-transpeptidase FtsI n=1 Tax=Candidatus Providencia siddallii TaxID=1715285 RepID=A0A0M6W7U2_9GAMM|nr:Peptidoglycan synthase FtsI [Candidatus Providencia siddallii]